MLDFFDDRPCRAEAIGEFSDITGRHGGETATLVGLNTSQVSKLAWCLPTSVSGRRPRHSRLLRGFSVPCWRWSVVLGHRDNVPTPENLLDRVNGPICERLPTIDLTTFRAKRFEWSSCLLGLLSCRRAPLKHSSRARPRNAPGLGSAVRQAPWRRASRLPACR